MDATRATTSSAPPRRAGVGQGLIIVLAGFLPIMAIVALAPAVPSVMAHFAGVPNAITFVPLMVTAPGLMIALSSPLVGWAADRYGRRPVLLPATALYGLLGMAPIFIHSLGGIFASRLGLGVTEAAILTVMNTLIGDYFDVPQRRRWLTVQGVVGPFFGTGVVALGGVLTDRAWNGAFMIYGVAIPIFIAMIFYIFEPARSASHAAGEPTPDEPFPWRAVAGFSLVTLFTAVLYYVFIVQGGLAFDAVGVKSPKTLGFLISMVSFGVLLGALGFGFLSRRLGASALIAIYLALLGTGMAGIGLATSPGMLMAFAVIQQMGAGMAVPSLILWATSSLPEAHRGRGMGAWSTAFFLGQFASPIIVGAVRGATGGILPAFAVMGAAALAGALVAVARCVAGARPARSAASAA